MFEELARGWKAYTLLAALALGFASYLYLEQANEQIVGIETTAVIVSFGGGASSQIFEPGEIRVTVQSDEGSIGAAQVLAHQIEGCKVGDRIPAIAKGINLEPRPVPCS